MPKNCAAVLRRSMKKGLEEAKALYLQKGRPMLHALFPDEEGRIAVGLAGHGSECFG